ncbi:MAG: glycosyltransferase family 8 protein [Verrucomicrobiales bacterium]|nr:glycosyltransferase family 8 protein [Verrucomicrobiales bacterium]
MHIVFVTDGAFALPVRAAIRSVLANAAGDRPLTVYVVYDREQVCSADVEQFTALDASVRVVPVTNRHRQNLHSRAHYSHAMYLKYDLPELFSNLDRVLYLDGDVIVNGDLRKFYDTDLSNKYAAVVENPLSSDVAKYVRGQLKCTGRYLNSGVMLFNLATMRRDKIPHRLAEFTAARPWLAMPDQDAFCTVLDQRVAFVDATYNLMVMYRDLPPFKNITQPRIIHYASGRKPWKDAGMYAANEFLRHLSSDDCCACLPAWLNTIRANNSTVDNRLLVLERQARNPWRHLAHSLFYEKQVTTDGVIRKYKLMGLTLATMQRTNIRHILRFLGIKISWRIK